MGCGLDTGAWDLLERGLAVTAIDISQVAIDQAAARAGERGFTNATFLKMNAEKMDFPDHSFDVVVGDGIIHHLDTEAAAIELARCLAPGGPEGG